MKGGISLIVLLGFSTIIAATSRSATPAKEAEQVGWVSTPSCNGLCHGVYLPLSTLGFSPRSDKLARIQADQMSYLSSGKIEASGHVEIRAADGVIETDQGRVIVDPRTQKLTGVELIAPTRFLTRGLLLWANRGSVDSLQDQAHFRSIVFRLDSQHELSGTQSLPFWGKAQEVSLSKTGPVKFKKVSVHTCPPDQPGWDLRAQKLQWNRRTGRASIRGAVLDIRGIPIFYWPYLNVPVDRSPHSGLLFPSIRFDKESGFTGAFPIYWILSPHWDTVLTPAWVGNRGLQGEAVVHYAFSHTKGRLEFTGLFNDRAFAAFKRQAEVLYPISPWLDKLQSADLTRTSWRWRHYSQGDGHWRAWIDYREVSDDYFIRDFTPTTLDRSEGWFLQRARVEYASDPLSVLVAFDHPVVLHPVDRQEVDPGYARLPDIRVSAILPSQWHFATAGLEGQFVNFTKGVRISAEPFVRLRSKGCRGYLDSRVALHLQSDVLPSDRAASNTHPAAVIPMVKVAGGTTWSHALSLDSRYTFEPEIAYLYVPYRDQSQFPLFDTTEKLPQYATLFESHRLSGGDRLGDLNTVAVGVVSRWIDQGSPRLIGRIGQSFSLTEPRMTLHPVSTRSPRSSPIVAEATYALDPAWGASADLAWDPNRQAWNHHSIGLTYAPDLHHRIDVRYFAAPEAPLTTTEGTRGWSLAGQWSFGAHWSLVGQWNERRDQGRSESEHVYFAGLGYEDCCWAVRWVITRALLGEDPAGVHSFDRSTSIQFVLKGLGSLGNADVQGLLDQAMPGTIDDFGRRGK